MISPTTMDFRPTSAAPSALVFSHYAECIRREEGIDVYEAEATLVADLPVIRRLLSRFRKDKIFADESILDAVWSDYLRAKGVLSPEEQHAKDQHSLQLARDSKAALAGTSDAARFGYCKRKGCANRAIERLLLRGFCGDCRGVLVKQTIAEGGTFSTLFHKLADATTPQMQTSIEVSVNRKKIHPSVKQQTTEERRAMVLKATEEHPSASQREIAKLTKVPQKTVSDILRKTVFENTKPANTDEVQPFLKERVERQPSLRAYARRYLKVRGIGQPPQAENDGGSKATDQPSLYVLGETTQTSGSKTAETTHLTPIVCTECSRTVIPAYHLDSRGQCMTS